MCESCGAGNPSFVCCTPGHASDLDWYDVAEGLFGPDGLIVEELRDTDPQRPPRGSDCEFCGGYPARFGCTHNP